jgi:hypothetical protein
MKKLIKKLLRPIRWVNLRTTKPISKVFGLDRGTPIDRYYIDLFLHNNKSYIRGNVLEIENNFYTKKYAVDLSQVQSEILHYTSDNPKATIIGDLTDKTTLPQGNIDCFICTQTFNFIYDFKEAIQGAHSLLKKDGVLLATLAGVCQISQYDMERWGDFWRFTSKSAQRAFEEVFGAGNVEVAFFGNVLSSVSLLHGISAEELTKEELDYSDPNYQIIITVIAKK